MGCENYVSDFYKDLAFDKKKTVNDRLKKTCTEWMEHSEAVKRTKTKVRYLPCLSLPDPTAFKIVETNASDFSYSDILMQKINSNGILVAFTSSAWNDTRKNYSTIKKVMLTIVLSINKFQGDLLNQKISLKIDCMSAKYVINKDIQNLASKEIFTRWQAILTVFYFDIKFIRDNSNLPDFLNRDFLQDITLLKYHHQKNLKHETKRSFNNSIIQDKKHILLFI